MSALLDPQPAPAPGSGDIWAEVLADPWIAATVDPEVLADMAARRLHGIATYGTPLQLGNARDARADAYQELLDAVVYAQLRMMEWDSVGHGMGVLQWRSIRNAAAELAQRVRTAP